MEDNVLLSIALWMHKSECGILYTSLKENRKEKSQPEVAHIWFLEYDEGHLLEVLVFDSIEI